MVIFRESTEDIRAGIEWETGSPECRKVVAADRIVKGLGATLAQMVVTCDFAHLTEGAKGVKCWEFGSAIVENMRKL